MANMFQTILDRFRADQATEAKSNGEGTKTELGYHILDPMGRRKPVRPVVNREDEFTQGRRHEAIQATAAELARNQSLASWMVRRHLDYVSMFRFQSRTGDPTLDDDLEGMMEENNNKNRADIAGRFTREKLFRLAETRRVLDGDTGLLKLADGRLQGIQADLIRDPDTARAAREDDRFKWISGVQVNGAGRPLQFGIWERKGYTGKKHFRNVRARNLIYYGFWDRYASDQTRGVSPMVSALAPLQDVYENFNYALAKSKVSQILALAFFRDGNEPVGDIEKVYATQATDATDIQKPREYKVNFGGAPKVLNLDPGDRAEFLESKNPSTEFQSFTELVIQVSLKSLDIPYSFYDEAHTNFFGSRAAWQHYDRSCKDKRDDQLELRREYTVWQYALMIQSGRLRLPRTMTIRDLPFEWVPLGMPWWDPSKEVKGHVSAMENALDNPQRICRSSGSDFYDNVDRIAEAQEYAESKGVRLAFATGDTSTEEPPANDGDTSQNDEDLQ